MLIVILHSCFTPLREQSKAWTMTCLTSEFLLCTVSVLQSKLWPTSWSPPQCGTVSLACPTRRGLVLPRFDSGETKATDTQVTEKEAAVAICTFRITKKSLLYKIWSLQSQSVQEITPQNGKQRKSQSLTRPPYCSIGAGSTRPVTWAISSLTLNWNSWTNGSAS